MRKLINISKKEQKELLVQFSDILKVDACENSHEYKKIAVSVFDHWLSKDEALASLNNVSEEEKWRRNNLHYSFNKILVDSSDCFTYRLKSRSKNHPVFKKFIDKEAAYSYIKPTGNATPSKCLYKIVFPRLNALYYEGYDYTCYLYYKNEKLLNNVFKLIPDSGLYILY